MTSREFCRKDGGSCEAKSLVCRFNLNAGEQVFRNLGDVVSRPFPNYMCFNFGREGSVFEVGYEFHPEVSMGGYVPLKKRFHVKSVVKQEVFGVIKQEIVAVVDGKKRFNYGSMMIQKLLKQEKDFNRGLEMVVCFLEGYEPWRLSRKNYDGSVRKDILSVVEILALKRYHASVWGR